DDPPLRRLPRRHRPDGARAAGLHHRCRAADHGDRRVADHADGLPPGGRGRGTGGAGRPRGDPPRPPSPGRPAGDRQPPRAGSADRHRARPRGRAGESARLRRRSRDGQQALVLCQHAGQPGACFGDGAGGGGATAGRLAGRRRAGGRAGAAERVPALRAEHRAADAAHRRPPGRCLGALPAGVDRGRDRRGGRLQPPLLALRPAHPGAVGDAGTGGTRV
ncbi:MAG: DnaD/phage-associated domain protein, partial [uncultured Thermomicrobiales bacterium]